MAKRDLLSDIMWTVPEGVAQWEKVWRTYENQRADLRRRLKKVNDEEASELLSDLCKKQVARATRLDAERESLVQDLSTCFRRNGDEDQSLYNGFKRFAEGLTNTHFFMLKFELLGSLIESEGAASHPSELLLCYNEGVLRILRDYGPLLIANRYLTIRHLLSDLSDELAPRLRRVDSALAGIVNDVLAANLMVTKAVHPRQHGILRGEFEDRAKQRGLGDAPYLGKEKWRMKFEAVLSGLDCVLALDPETGTIPLSQTKAEEFAGIFETQINDMGKQQGERRRHLSYDALECDVAQSGPDPLAAFMDREEVRGLLKVAALGTNERQIIELMLDNPGAAEAYGGNQILSEMTGRPANQIGVEKKRAIDNMRKALEQSA